MNNSVDKRQDNPSKTSVVSWELDTSEGKCYDNPAKIVVKAYWGLEPREYSSRKNMLIILIKLT